MPYPVFRGGNESDNTPLYIARAEFNGGVHNGKVRVGDVGEFPLVIISSFVLTVAKRIYPTMVKSIVFPPTRCSSVLPQPTWYVTYS